MIESRRLTSRASLTFRELKQTLQKWRDVVPYIHPMQAVKAFPEPRVIEFLHNHGVGFDCASATEIAMVREQSGDIIFANPTKSIFDIKYATNQGVHTYVVDSVEEVQKIQILDPLAEYVVRITANEEYSRLPFNSKQGASPADVTDTLKWIAENNLRFAGFSQHVGSLCDNMAAHAKTIGVIVERQMPEAATLGLKTHIVDIGGGFQSATDLPELHRELRGYLGEFERGGVRMVAEPGRLFAAPCLELTLEVIAVRRRRGGVQMVTFNDGIYHTLQSKIYDDQTFTPEPVGDMTGRPLVRCVVFGHTCDSRDVICEDIELPLPAVGDKQRLRNVGAQTLASARGEFNGFSAAELVVEEGAATFGGERN